MDQYEYMALVHERQDRNRTILGLGAFLSLAFGLMLLGFASQKTEIKKTGIIGFRKETIVPIPAETRLALLFGGIVLMLVAFALALIAYRASRWHGALMGGQVTTGSRATGSSTSTDSISSAAVASGSSKEFWIQTTIAVLGLIITAASAAVAWWAG
ncbi:hypothetical protein L2K70_10285 [Nocardioides KLBMP 9356]|uniref:Uncharacterized protein n=1 Tax=Nocardioides potassii TaxID=2911371 RepID=A0ABS9HD49_9ACTN|nr:hypothetical protein [Nocardioides potassii]MCF6377993.1 hypothetical protein [Nocardioides potassii]